MTTRCKFRLVEITSREGGYDRYRFSAQYDTSIPEDQRFSKATPSGEFEMTVDNPAVKPMFAVGKTYYFDVTEAPAPTS